ncbi:actin maturation protease isoform X3 [Mirounga angustirostris]|uniref:actin maturation protease isoform X3 n=1 Tax=Mirounga angustirostris TaxID=9716 RepID=UPI00313DC2BA
MDPLLCRPALPHPGRPSVRAGGLVDGRHTAGTTQWHPPGETCADGRGERLHGPGRDVLRRGSCSDDSRCRSPVSPRLAARHTAILLSLSPLQWPTWASWPGRHWAARLSSSTVAWAVPTEPVSCSTLSPDTPCSSRIPRPRGELGGDGEGWIPGPHHSFGLNPPGTSYDEDFNHEPCQRKGHKAHWAVSTGVLLGVRAVPGLGYSEDPELPGLFHPVPSMPRQPPALPEEGSPGAVYLLSKQGKSWHYQLWDYDQVRDSNLQLTDFSPSRAADGRAYVVPAGGVRAGLCGQALLLRPGDSSH